jgi:hypothetical protein
MEPFYESDKWRFLRECVFAYWGEKCLKCGSLDKLHVDHVIPRSKAAHLSLDFHNLQPLCESCNLEKSNKSCADYRREDRLNPSNEVILMMLGIWRKRKQMPVSLRRGPMHISRVLPRAFPIRIRRAA